MENTQQVPLSVERSETIGELAKALAKFQGKVKTVSKNAENPFYKSKYASLDNIIETIREELATSELAVTQFPHGKDELTTILVHSSGEYIQASVKFTPKDNSPQAIGSAITYMRRYSLSAVLGIATDEDDDGNAATTPVNTAKAPAPVKKAPAMSDQQAMKKLRSATNEEELKTFWSGLSQSLKKDPEVVAVKDEMKEQLLEGEKVIEA